MSPKKPGAGPTSKLTRRQVLKAARRYYINGETQTLIANSMGISPSYLARVLKKAKDDGLVRIYVDSDRETELAAQLEEKYPHLAHVEVVPNGPTPEHTAHALGTVAARWLDDLIDEDEVTGHPVIENVAIGGGMVHEAMVDQLIHRKTRISVGPTALTPQMGKTDRFTAVSLSTALAMKWGAVGPGAREQDRNRETGWLYTATVEPPDDSLEALSEWYKRLQLRPGYVDLLRFWNQVNVTFVSVVSPDWRYADVHARLRKLGLSTKEMINRGAKAIFANRFLDANGQEIPLSEGLPSYEPVMPTDAIRSVVSRHTETQGRRGYVALDAWGEPGVAAEAVIRGELVNVLFCDSHVASFLIHLVR